MGFSLGGHSNHGIGIDAFPGETRLSQSPWRCKAPQGPTYRAFVRIGRHTFSTWQALFLPEVYRELCEAKVRLDAAQNLRATNPNYFPAYRCPTVPL